MTISRATMPCFWQNATTNKALELYARAFEDFEIKSSTAIGPDDSAFTAIASLYGTEFQLLDGGPDYTPHHGLSLLVTFTDREALTRAYDSLAETGFVMMGLDSYPHSDLYAWVADEFGISWQLMLGKDGDTPAMSPCLMFGGKNQDRAKMAVDHYVASFVSLNEPAEITARVMYPDNPERVMFSRARLGSCADELSAMDSAVEQDLEHTPGCSLVIECETQSEIDHLWDALCANENAAQCGWCVDQFGISWQIVPRGLGQMLSRPEVQEAFQKMKKIIISDLLKA